MSDAGFAKCSCQVCATHLEFPVEAEGSRIPCPNCGGETTLTPDSALGSIPSTGASPGPTTLTLAEIEAAFAHPVPKTRVSFFYQIGLMVVALAMVLLPLVYLAMIGAAIWGVWYWATHFNFLLSGSGGRVWVVKFLAYATPLFAGAVLVFFMIKPLFARRAPRAQPLALNRGAEPLLFAFVTRLCQAVGAPFPTRIDIDCQLNASASFRRGAFSLLGNDLVLTIGLPLVAGLRLRELAGVLAHEFGHFSQGFGMRLTYVIRSVNAWFARVIYERDAWDLMLQEAGENEDPRIAIVVGFARLGVWFSRLLLRLLMFVGHGIGCFMLRQMEYDADSYEIKLAGSESFESTMRRIHVLGNLMTPTYKDVRTSWNLNRHLPENLPAYLLWHDARLFPTRRTQLEDTMGLDPTGWFDTHPSNGDRIGRARQAADPGVMQVDGAATALFSNFDAVARQVTYLHYADDLGMPMEMAKLMPVDTSEPPAD